MPEQTDRNVYILGAGFSQAAGAPLIRDFLNVSRTLLDDPLSQLADAERDRFRKVFEFRRRMAQSKDKVRIDLDNIEELFGLAEMSHRLGLEPPETRSHIVFLIVKTLQHTVQLRRQVTFVPEYRQANAGRRPPAYYVPDPHNSQSFHLELYAHFAALLLGALDDSERSTTRRDSVITFNYDLVVEKALHGVGAHPFYHREINFAGGQGAPKISVLKLHGSVNWGICRGCQTRYLSGQFWEELTFG